ncbi:MAG: lamin tail domain-containing protein, partial [Flavobacteriales bacterium]|nr:lamin tail domain-containing protein [Flavobacteriales bacterium]
MLRTLLVPVLIFTTVLGYSQYVVDFEGAGETKGGYASGTVTLTDLDWNLTDALIAITSPGTSDFMNGSRSMRLRGYATSSATMLEDKPGGLGSISFNYRRYGTDSQVAWIVEYSTNGGGAWTPIGSPFTATEEVQSFSVTGINAAGNVRIRFRTEATGSSNRRANIDDITITDAVTGCGFTLGAVTAECNGFTGADDTYDLSIEFFGTEAGVTVDYTGTGTVDLSSGDPATDVFGTILVTGISELEDYSVTFSAPCDVLVVAGTAPVCEAPPTLVINEILADPDLTEGDANGDMVVDTSEDEFVEIVNFGATDIDISGWTLSDAGQVRHVFPPATTVAAGCAIVVFGGGTPTGTFGGATVQTASSGLLGLNNTGDDVILENGSGVVASYSYGGEGGNNASLVRDEDITGPEPLVVHSIATGSGGAAQSPGTRIDGTLFGGCPVPACTVVFLTPEVTCESLMSGPGDTYSVSIPYTGSQGGITVVNSSGSGSVSGDDPATTSGGTILITGISDADAYSISLSSPCDEQIVSGAAPACEPPITLVINEVDYDNVGNDDDEWVEIHNYGLDPIDLDGFQLEFGNGASGVLYETILLPAVSLPAGGYFVVGNSATNPGVDFQFGTANLIQNGGSDGMALRGPLGQIVDALSYEGNCGAPYIEGTGFTGADDNSTEGRTIARVPNGTDTNDNASDWIVWCATIGASNDSDDDDDAIANCQDPCPLAVSGITNFDENTCACLLGYYATVEDVNGNNVITACTICPPGTYCADGLVSIPCPVGRFQSLEGQVSCVDCVEGTFNGSLGATSCQPCEPGYFSNVTGASFCQACAAGEFSDQFGSSECQACPAGTYNPNEGMTECLACDSEESSMPGSTECFFDLTCTTDMSLDITLPALGTLPTYELRRSLNDQLIVSGGGGVGNAGITPFTFCLPDGKFYLVLNDMPAGGKYLLRTDGSPNIRFIDDQEPAANNQVTEFTVSPSTLNSRGAVQIPAGPTEFLYTSCDKYF